MMDGILGIGNVGRIYAAPAGSVNFEPIELAPKPVMLATAENGDGFGTEPTNIVTIECRVEHKRTKKGKIRRDKALERLLSPKRYRLPRKMKKRLKRENGGLLPCIMKGTLIGIDNETLIIQADGLQYGTQKNNKLCE